MGIGGNTCILCKGCFVCSIKLLFIKSYRFGSGRPNICVICEYDALPDIGHACGHNLIAVVGIATGLAIKEFIEKSQMSTTGFSGTVTVMGTPAEESIGGKAILIERGAFKDIDLALMAHPTPYEVAMPKFLCINDFEVIFKGKAAHAAAFPWEGVNALDAAVLAYTNISALRQQMKPTWRVHGVFTDGGVKPNIIPEKASLLYYVRCETKEELAILREKVIQCCKGASEATGCSYEIKKVGNTYENLKSNEILAKMYMGHMKTLGIDVDLAGDCPGSTDMGNVSHVVPSIHPIYKIDSEGGNHTRKFTAATNTESAHDKTLTVAKALSLVCVDVLAAGGDEILKNAQKSFLDS